MLQRAYTLSFLCLMAVLGPVALFESHLEKVRPSHPDPAHGYVLFFKGASRIIYISADDHWWMSWGGVATLILFPPIAFIGWTLDRREKNRHRA